LNDQFSILNTHHRTGDDIDSLLDIRAIFQQGFRDIEFENLHPLLRPTKGRLGLKDYEKAFCADLKSGEDIFTLRAIDRVNGCLVIVRPDQYVAHILPINAHHELTTFFNGVFCV